MRLRCAAGAILSALALAAPAAGHVAGALQLDASFRTAIARASCPPGVPETTECYDISGTGVIRGLGTTSIRYTLGVATDAANEACRHWSAPSVAVTVVGKGSLSATASNPGCQPPGGHGTMAFAVTGGSGAYAGASGGGMVQESGSVETGGGLTALTGTLTVPGLEFDVTPPVLSGAHAKKVRAPRRAKRVRVRYAVRAADAVDGAVTPSCKPASGSLFRVGRTHVTCTAIDSSGNAAMASFTITVKRRR